MSVFKKPKKNIQRRAFSDFPDEDRSVDINNGEEREKGENGAAAKPKERKPEKEKKSKTLLSFGDEEGRLLESFLSLTSD